MRIAIFFFGAVIGFWIANFLAGKKAGEEGRIRSLKFIWRNYIFLIIKWKEIYEVAEIVLDKCEDVANIVESIIVKQG